MSAYTNSNYPPPMGQMNLVNGMPQQPQQQQSSQQQPQQQQLMGSQFHQQQQQILQQKQQQQQQQQQQHPNPQQLLGAPPAINNMSKFMPPSASIPMTAASSSGAAMPQRNNSIPPAVAMQNGPPRALPPQAPPSHLPPHMRPPGINGPPSATATAGPPLSNGGGGGSPGDFSANSSRTASPALQNSPSQHFPAGPKPAMVPGMVPSKFTAPSTNASGPPPTSTTTSTALSNSMQNLSLNGMNGPGAQPTMAQQQYQQRLPPTSNSFPANLQGSFKTSALNANSPMLPPTAHQQQQQQTSTSAIATSIPPRPPQMTQATNSQYNQFQPQPPPQYQPQQAQISKSVGNTVSSAPSTLSSQPSSMYGTSTAPLMMRPAGPPQSSPLNPTMQNSNYPPTGMMPPTNSFQQNKLNNNQPPISTPQQAPMSQARKPMYPTSAQLPPMPNQQQQQQPYAQAYHQQPQQPGPPAATFNGQTNTGPLQYQSMQQQQQQQQQQQYPGAQPLNVVQQGFSRLWGQDTVDLMQNRHILSPATLPTPKIVLHNQFHESINCNPSIMRCTVAKIPESNSLLQKSRLPLGILIHPFRDVNSLPVIQCPNIVRCRLCRTYINPFVYFVDSKMWKCNLCYRVNELPDEFQFDPQTKTYGDVTRRPEVRSSTIEFIAPSEYMLRPPQPAIYLFLFDVSIIAQQSGYLENVCAVLSKHLDDMPGDARTQVGFIAYNSQVHFYSMADGYNQPHEMTLLDIDDPFLPRPDNLLVNLKECKELVKDLLTQLPKRFADTHDPGSALGAALQVAYKLMQASGGRVSVFQTCLPNKGPGSLEPREDPNNRSAKDVAHLNPATDFYKRYALECSSYQIAVDLFLLNQQYSDLATISGISKHSGGCVHHFPLYQKTKPQHVDSFKQCFKRYLVRKIGFEAVMRIRCTRGLQVHTFHGNFFVRSTDLLSLPNVNPDAGYGMQISYEESLTDVKTICFQAALLYTNSEGERRIRVHTLCLPVTASLSEVMHAADTEAIIGLLSKMAVDRSITSNVADAREAFINATVDILSAFRIAQNLPSGQTGQLIAPRSLALMPLYILALLKHPAFRVGTSTRLDDRVYAMDCMKTLPLDQLMKFIYPEFYQIDALFYNAQNSNTTAADDEEEDDLPDLSRLQLSAEYLDSRSTFLLDCGSLIIIYVGLNVPVNILENVFGIKSTAELPDYYYGLPTVNSPENDALKRFIMRLNDEKPYPPIVQIIRDTSTAKPQFIEKLVDDRSESSLSYYEFLQHIRTQVK